MGKLVKRNPFRDLIDVRDDFDRLVDRMFGRDIDLFEGKWKEPSIDLYEEENNIKVKAELPGIKKEDISVKVTEDTLTVSGKKSSRKEINKENYYTKEISEGSYTRTISLPAEVDREKVKASYKDGVLEIELPKSPQKQAMEVNIDVD
jgi:HSP20 family protein